MTRRTRITFQPTVQVWPILESWAEEQGFRLRETLPSGRLYQKGVGFWVAPMMLEVQCTDSECTLVAWVRVNLFVRLMCFFILPSEMGVESEGFRGTLPRSIARNALNKLLPRLGQPPIL